MYGLLIALHVLICLCLICVILLQSGKGGGLAGGAFGGTAQTVFGGRGATDFMTRATMVLGAAFFATSLVLALMTSGTRGTPSRSLIQEQARRATTAQPRPAPGATAPAPGPTAPGSTAPAPGGTQGPTAPPAGSAPPAGTAPQQPAPTQPPPGGGGNR